jgi:hypothetical protein
MTDKIFFFWTVGFTNNDVPYAVVAVQLTKHSKTLAY